MYAVVQKRRHLRVFIVLWLNCNIDMKLPDRRNNWLLQWHKVSKGLWSQNPGNANSCGRSNIYVTCFSSVVCTAVVNRVFVELRKFACLVRSKTVSVLNFVQGLQAKFYAAVLIGRITSFARLSVCLTVPCGLADSRMKSLEKIALKRFPWHILITHFYYFQHFIFSL